MCIRPESIFGPFARFRRLCQHRIGSSLLPFTTNEASGRLSWSAESAYRKSKKWIGSLWPANFFRIQAVLLEWNPPGWSLRVLLPAIPLFVLSQQVELPCVGILQAKYNLKRSIALQGSKHGCYVVGVWLVYWSKRDQKGNRFDNSFGAGSFV